MKNQILLLFICLFTMAMSGSEPVATPMENIDLNNTDYVIAYVVCNNRDGSFVTGRTYEFEAIPLNPNINMNYIWSAMPDSQTIEIVSTQGKKAFIRFLKKTNYVILCNGQNPSTGEITISNGQYYVGTVY